MTKYIEELDKVVLDKIDSFKYSDEKREFRVPESVTIGWKEVLADPPDNSSETTKKELAYISELTSNLSSSELDLIKLVDANPNLLYHKILKKHGLEFPYKMFGKAWDIISPVIKNLKYKFNRPRPYQLAPIYDIKIRVTETSTHHTPAYPSGHTAYAALGAYILSAKYPDYSSEFFSKVSAAGMARMLQGVHYPSDNEASMIISAAVWENIRYDLFPELKNF
tara:strand:+ start:661 stop:1329 length:669 start_codon:yes stop_codon:yes gene_type:complete